MKRINKIVVKKELDTNPQLDYLGSFSDEPGKFAIEHNGGRGTFKFFNADNVENMKQARENYRRMMEYDSGQLCDYGVTAYAEIYTGSDGKTWLINKIHSGGLWGLSSDGSAAEFDSEAENQRAELAETLKEFGFTEDEIFAAPVSFENWD